MKNVEINTKAVKKLFAAGLLTFTMTGCTGNGEPVKDDKPEETKTEEVISNNDDVTITQEEAEEMLQSYERMSDIKVIDYGTSRDEYKNGQEVKEMLDDVELENKGFMVYYYFDQVYTSVDGEVSMSDEIRVLKPESETVENEYPSGATSISHFKYAKIYKIVGVAESEDYGLTKMALSDGKLVPGGPVLTEELINEYSSKTLTK